MTDRRAEVVLGPELARAAMLGAATGARSFTGLAGLVLATPGRARTQPDRTFRRPWVKALIGLGAVQELVMDKLPQAPSRLEPLGLSSRVVCAATCGVVEGRRTDESSSPASTDGTDPDPTVDPAGSRAQSPPWLRPVVCATVAVGTSLAMCWAGPRWREFAAATFGTDWIGAVVEDAAALGLTAAAIRL